METFGQLPRSVGDRREQAVLARYPTSRLRTQETGENENKPFAGPYKKLRTQETGESRQCSLGTLQVGCALRRPARAGSARSVPFGQASHSGDRRGQPAMDTGENESIITSANCLCHLPLPYNYPHGI